jgi:signal transduction histidine kinase
MIRPNFPSRRNRNDPFDRIIAFFAVLVVMGPILAYAWVALDADKANRTQLALDRSLGTAQLVAGLVDEHCEKIVAALKQLANRPDLINPNGSPARTKEILSKSALTLPELAYLSVYDSSGKLIQTVANRRGPQPQTSRRELAERFAKTTATRIAYTEHHLADDTILLAVPLREDAGIRGMVAAALPSSAFNGWLAKIEVGGSNLYVVDEAGHILTYFGPAWHRHLPLGDYQPTKNANSGQKGYLQSYGPDGSQESFIGYAYAAFPRCAVLIVTPVGDILDPTNGLIQRLSLLLLPILLLVSAWAWQRIQSERRIGDLARQLADQNEALRKADQAKSEFLANVSHDLRTPLAAMQVSISGLLESRSRWTQSEVKETLGVVGEEIDQLSARVRNLLDMARLESGAGALSRQPEDLTDIVSSALERLEPITRGNQLHADFPPEPLMIDGDQERLETVVINLMENAVKYSPEGSTIHLQGQRLNGKVSIRIWDEGQGLQPGDEEKVFEMYYRSGRGRAIRGTGVGLAICRAIIEAHGGRIGATRAPTGGAEFWFTLDALDTEMEPEVTNA